MTCRRLQQDNSNPEPAGVRTLMSSSYNGGNRKDFIFVWLGPGKNTNARDSLIISNAVFAILFAGNNLKRLKSDLTKVSYCLHLVSSQFSWVFNLSYTGLFC